MICGIFFKGRRNPMAGFLGYPGPFAAGVPM
jgi:hypothetical protein